MPVTVLANPAAVSRRYQFADGIIAIVLGQGPEYDALLFTPMPAIGGKEEVMKAIAAIFAHEYDLLSCDCIRNYRNG